MPCPNEIVYKQLRDACPHDAEGDCRHLCSIYEKGYGYSHIGDAAKTFNDFAECHVNTVEYKNVSLTSPKATTSTENIRTHTSALSPPPTTREIRLMLIVLCSGIIFIILGGLCRSGWKKRKEMLKKRHRDDVEAKRMSVNIELKERDEPPVRIRRMSVGPEDVSRVGCMGCLFPRYPKLKEPGKKSNKERRVPGEKSENIERCGKL